MKPRYMEIDGIIYDMDEDMSESEANSLVKYFVYGCIGLVLFSEISQWILM